MKRIVLLSLLVSFFFSSLADAACSLASLSGAYGIRSTAYDLQGNDFNTTVFSGRIVADGAGLFDVEYRFSVNGLVSPPHSTQDVPYQVTSDCFIQGSYTRNDGTVITLFIPVRGKNPTANGGSGFMSLIGGPDNLSISAPFNLFKSQ